MWGENRHFHLPSAMFKPFVNIALDKAVHLEFFWRYVLRPQWCCHEKVGENHTCLQWPSLHENNCAKEASAPVIFSYRKMLRARVQFSSWQNPRCWTCPHFFTNTLHTLTRCHSLSSPQQAHSMLFLCWESVHGPVQVLCRRRPHDELQEQLPLSQRLEVPSWQRASSE